MKAREDSLRILHAYSGNLYGGVESLLLALAGDAGGGARHAYALCFEGRLRDELRAAGAEVHALGAVRVSRPWTIRRARAALSAVLASARYDAVVCHAPWAQAVLSPAARAAGLPVVFFQHDVARGTHWIERWAARTPPDLVLSNSAFAARSLPALYPHVPAVTVHLPVTFGSASASATEREQVRDELATPREATVIVQVSRMEAWKGHRLHLDALGRLRELPGWVAWFVGGAQRPHEARYLASLRAQADALGIADRVRFLGQRADVPRLLGAADVHCQPNTSPEPFGVAFVEALAAGLPVVSTAMGGALEIVDASCGVLVPADPVALARALRRLSVDVETRRRLGAAGPARARALCDPARQGARLIDAIAQIVPGARTSRAVGRVLSPAFAEGVARE